MAITVEEVADAMFNMVKDAFGVKKLKPMDLTKAMREHFGDECDKKLCKEAIKELVNSGRCVFRTGRVPPTTRTAHRISGLWQRAHRGS